MKDFFHEIIEDWHVYYTRRPATWSVKPLWWNVAIIGLDNVGYFSYPGQARTLGEARNFAVTCASNLTEKYKR